MLVSASSSPSAATVAACWWFVATCACARRSCVASCSRSASVRPSGLVVGCVRARPVSASPGRKVVLLCAVRCVVAA